MAVVYQHPSSSQISLPNGRRGNLGSNVWPRAAAASRRDCDRATLPNLRPGSLTCVLRRYYIGNYSIETVNTGG